MERFKDSKLIIGISLIIQAISFVVLFLIALGKRKSEAGAYLAVATVFTAAGAYLATLEKIEDDYVYGDFSRHFGDLDFDDDEDFDDSNFEVVNEKRKKIEIPVDETVQESEFEH